MDVQSRQVILGKMNQGNKREIVEDKSTSERNRPICDVNFPWEVVGASVVQR